MLNKQKQTEIFSIYDGGLKDMGEQKKINEENLVEEKADRKIGRYNSLANLAHTFLEILVIVIGVAFFIVSPKKDIETLQKDSTYMHERLDNLNARVESIEDISNSDHEILLELSSLIKDQPAYFVKINDEDMIKTETVNNEIFMSKLNVEVGAEVLFQEVDGETIYSMEDLYNVPIVTSYIENGKEIYFLGRFNENKNWNGKCILNTYDNDKLCSIFEGVYENGVLFSYKCLTGDDERWIINERVVHKGYNSGTTYVYTKSDDFIKNFTLDNVKEKQILDIETFLLSKNENLMSIYCGNTVRGRYNDDSGYAYFVKYKEDGTVEYLYKGKWLNGEENDSSGNAWYIGWGHANDGYHYYKGKFTGGEQDKKPKSWYEPLTQEEIDQIVDPDNFDCDLKGLVSTGL